MSEEGYLVADMTRDALLEAVARAIVSVGPRFSAQQARAALTAIEAEGFVVVPREPSRAMLDAASSDLARTGVCGIGQWNAMLAARPGAGGKQDGEPGW
ncbi:hypothetical protein HMPREF9946_03127 [Acetobacteraceae bacterium AT-5844]|nr:hypothetical protein HMPREF9946_03127 [Acetobacteraceae bacterium AT-5844]